MAPSLENWTSARPEVAGSEDTWLPRGRRAGAGPPETNCGVKSRGTIVSDNLLSTQDRQEALSRAYASAVAAGAGYVTYIPDYDRDSVDLGSAQPGRCVRTSMCSSRRQSIFGETVSFLNSPLGKRIMMISESRRRF